ncbi:hypothetical protein AB1L30_00120, partial [Bremerella sp. JC817]|uniref:hypothetical protein n=1 Tax=Bremerella sp. JC817 TaxID=3231756 RepID=UPI00345941AB
CVAVPRSRCQWCHFAQGMLLTGKLFGIQSTLVRRYLPEALKAHSFDGSVVVEAEGDDKIAAALREHLTKICPPGMKMELSAHHGSPGFVVSTYSP